MRERVAAVARVRRAVAAAADRRGVIAPGEAVVVACSGGPDSTALVDALARLAPPAGGASTWSTSTTACARGPPPRP